MKTFTIFEFLRNSFKAIRKWFGGQPKPTADNDDDKPSLVTENEEVPIEELSQLYQFNEKEFPEMSATLRKSVFAFMRGSWKLGFDDGKLGQKQMPRSFFGTQALQIQNQFLFFLKGKQVPLTTTLKERTERMNNAQESLKLAEEYRDDVMKRRQLYSRSFSRGLGWFYVIIGVLLIFADIPLALMATQFGFGIDYASITEHEVNNLFTLGERCNDAGENIVSHLLMVFAANWQVFLLTIGVAMCTIYIKIFYDDFMGFPADKAVRQFKVLSFNKHMGEFSDDEFKEIKKKYNIRLIAKGAILLLTLATIITMGFFRAKDGHNPALPEELRQSSALATTVFILIAILFPVVAGICFSIGMGNFHNLKEENYAEQHYKLRQDEFLKQQTAQTASATENETYEQFIQQCDDRFYKRYKKFFYNCYLHGYQRGVVSPDKDLDMFERAQRFRDRLIATKSAYAIQRANDNVRPIDPLSANHRNQNGKPS